jgi:hypothetical protein
MNKEKGQGLQKGSALSVDQSPTETIINHQSPTAIIISQPSSIALLEA